MWLTNPCGYSMVGFSGTIDVVGGLRRFSGSLTGGSGCTTFDLMELNPAGALRPYRFRCEWRGTQTLPLFRCSCADTRSDKAWRHQPTDGRADKGTHRCAAIARRDPRRLATHPLPPPPLDPLAITILVCRSLASYLFFCTAKGHGNSSPAIDGSDGGLPRLAHGSSRVRRAEDSGSKFERYA